MFAAFPSVYLDNLITYEGLTFSGVSFLLVDLVIAVGPTCEYFILLVNLKYSFNAQKLKLHNEAIEFE